jgi:adenylate cyclase
MSDAQAKQPHGLKATVREYLTHWTVAGLVVTLTGFTPDHWIAHALHEVPSGVRNLFPGGIDYRLVVVALGVLMIVADTVLRNWRRRKRAVPDAGTATAAGGGGEAALTGVGGKSPVLAGTASSAAFRRARRSRAASDAGSTGEQATGAVPASRVVVTQLRHDLRTPMNAILGYSEVLVEEAVELGVGHLKDELQRLQEDAKAMLERIGEALPAGAEGIERDPDELRAQVREKLDAPAKALLLQTRELFQKAIGIEAALGDLDRLVIATGKLSALVEGLDRPSDPATEQAGTPNVKETLGRLSSGSANAALAEGRLLIVDDNAMNRDLLSRQLAREGYTVMTSSSGQDALEKLSLDDYDLVLLDVVMPQMDGLQVLDRINSDARLSDVPVIMLSALDEIAGVARCLARGAADYLTKPVDPVLLRARVRSTLHIRRLREDLRHAEQELEAGHEVARHLAQSIVPASVAPRLERGEVPGCTHYPEVTALVVKIEGMDALAERAPADALKAIASVHELFESGCRDKNIVLSRMTDRTLTAVAGAPTWNERHACAAADLAIALQSAFATKSIAAASLRVRCGIHTSALTTGVVGGERLVLGLWGDAVSLAEALASSAQIGEIRVSNSAYSQLSSDYAVGNSNVLDLPGRGQVPTRCLQSR